MRIELIAAKRRNARFDAAAAQSDQEAEAKRSVRAD